MTIGATRSKSMERRDTATETDGQTDGWTGSDTTQTQLDKQQTVTGKYVAAKVFAQFLIAVHIFR